MADRAELVRSLNRFADIAAADSPLSAAFTRAAAADDTCLAILWHANPGQPPANLLLAAVHYLLLGGVRHSLSRFYPSISGDRSNSDAGRAARAFVDFCHAHEAAVRDLVATRRVQTNEVRRCVFLVPAFATAANGRNLALLEVGAAAGLNLCFDRFHYDYGGVETGPESPLVLTTEVRSGVPPIPDPLPHVEWRAGIDLSPIDLSDEHAVRWATALLWPEQLERFERFSSAVDLVRNDPPRVVAGDALDLLPRLAAEAPAGSALLVIHSFVLAQFTEEQRDRFDALLRTISIGREVDRIAVEMVRPEDDFPNVVHTRYQEGDASETTLGTVHFHGNWIEWR